MTYRPISNIGSADKLMKDVLAALGTSGIVPVVIDGSTKSVTIRSLTVLKDEIVVKCSDNQDGSTIVLHIPSDGPAAQADVISYTEGA